MNQEPAASFQRWLWCLAILDAALILSRPAAAQETKCPRGSACATISINGKQLPPPPQKFEERSGATSPTRNPIGQLRSLGRLSEKLFAAKLSFPKTGVWPTRGDDEEIGAGLPRLTGRRMADPGRTSLGCLFESLCLWISAAKCHPQPLFARNARVLQQSRHINLRGRYRLGVPYFDYDWRLDQRPIVFQGLPATSCGKKIVSNYS